MISEWIKKNTVEVAKKRKEWEEEVEQHDAGNEDGANKGEEPRDNNDQPQFFVCLLYVCFLKQFA